MLVDGTVVDGTGGARYVADVAVVDGRIEAIGELDPALAHRVIDASGKVIAPGFIDVHSHADGALDDPGTAGMEGYLRQGVTTAVYGVDGFLGLERLKEYAEMGEVAGMGMNFMSFIGHNAVRTAVMGQANRAPTDEEMAHMKAIVKEAMDFGAVGLSTGLMYLPGSYATTEEVIELAGVTAPYDGRYDSHVRDPAKNLLESHQEALAIARDAGVHAHPGHVKAVAAVNFGKGPELAALFQAAIDRGQEVTVDLYPYDGAATAPVMALLYPGDDERGEVLMERMQSLDDSRAIGQGESGKLARDLQQYWRDMADKPEILALARERTENPPDGLYSWINVVGYQSMRIVVSENGQYEGMMVSELAEQLDITPFELYRRLIATEGDTVTVTLGAIQENDIRAIMKQPWAMISSDGEEVAPDHPRGRGSFPRVLGRYVREWRVLSLEEGVHKMSGLPARYLGLQDRGILREGAIADIVVFDPETIIDRATWAEPARFAEGIEHVYIGGQPALSGGELTASRLGRFIPFGPGRR
jgi:N-acyl-D-aspartate/D-glutamate deacylase